MSDGHVTRVGASDGQSAERDRNPTSSDGLFEANLAALTSFSSAARARMRRSAPDGDCSTLPSASGSPIVVWHGRALDSRRDPLSAAQQAVSRVSDRAVVLLGLGSGYIAEALLARGIAVAAVVERADILAAASRARDLRTVFESTLVIAVEDLGDRQVLAALRACAHRVLCHAPSVAISPELGALADRWDALPVARQPRVLVVGPTSGGSLGIARHVAAAARRAGAEVRFFDASPFGTAHHAFRDLSVATSAESYLVGKFTLLLGEAIVASAVEWRPDLLIALAQAPLTEPALTSLRSLGVPTVFWFVENVRVLPYWRDVMRHYDHVYGIQPDQPLEEMRRAGAASPRYLPMASDPAVHRPMALTAEERGRFGSPVSFAGAPYLNRRHVLSAVADLGLRLWGDGWNRTALAPLAPNAARFDIDDMVRIFAATEVNLNLHSADHVTGLDPDPDYVNPRTFELAACGAFQLVDWRSPLSDLFEDTEIVTFRTVQEMRALTEHFLARPDERVEIATRARARTLADHTYDRRVARMFDETLPPHLQPGLASAPETLDMAVALAMKTPMLSADEALLRMLVDVRDSVNAK